MHLSTFNIECRQMGEDPRTMCHLKIDKEDKGWRQIRR